MVKIPIISAPPPLSSPVKGEEFGGCLPNAIHHAKIGSRSYFLMKFILVKMFSGEGQFIIQPVGEKNLINARTAVFEPG